MTRDAIDRERFAIAERLRRARELAGLSQAQAAKILGLHRPAISEIESGRRRVAAEEIKALAETYGVNVGWLLTAEVKQSVSRTLADVKMAARTLNAVSEADLEFALSVLAAVLGDDEEQE